MLIVKIDDGLKILSTTMYIRNIFVHKLLKKIRKSLLFLVNPDRVSGIMKAKSLQKNLYLEHFNVSNGGRNDDRNIKLSPWALNKPCLCDVT